jgi:TolB protein
MEGKFIMSKIWLLHRKNYIYFCISILTCLTVALLACPALAQSREYVTVKAPITKKYVIAVPALQGPGDCGPELGTALAAQANQDLRGSGHFTVLDPAAFDSSPIGPSPSTAKLSALAALGSNLAIAGGWQQQGQQLTLDLKLVDPASGQMLLGKRYRGGPNDGRRMMTQFVNEVVTYLTGERGIPQGRLAFISGTTDRRELYTLDLGGAARQITRLGTITLTPSWSPDGQEIFICSYRGGFPALYAVNPGSGSVRKLIARRSAGSESPYTIQRGPRVEA